MFCLNAEVTNSTAYPESDPCTATGIDVVEDGTKRRIPVCLDDIVIVTLGSTSAGTALGTNVSSPPNLSVNWKDRMFRDWRL